jgi:hypothetical protein
VKSIVAVFVSSNRRVAECSKRKNTSLESFLSGVIEHRQTVNDADVDPRQRKQICCCVQTGKLYLPRPLMSDTRVPCTHAFAVSHRNPTLQQRPVQPFDGKGKWATRPHVPSIATLTPPALWLHSPLCLHSPTPVIVFNLTPKNCNPVNIVNADPPPLRL